MPKLRPILASLACLASLLTGTLSACAKAPDPNCGLRPGDWCPAPLGDPCGRHKNVEDCKADPKCGGMGYRGESVEACHSDARGFATNCPTVGCQSLTQNPKTPDNKQP